MKMAKTCTHWGCGVSVQVIDFPLLRLFSVGRCILMLTEGICQGGKCHDGDKRMLSSRAAPGSQSSPDMLGWLDSLQCTPSTRWRQFSTEASAPLWCGCEEMCSQGDLTQSARRFNVGGSSLETLAMVVCVVCWMLSL